MKKARLTDDGNIKGSLPEGRVITLPSLTKTGLEKLDEHEIAAMTGYAADTDEPGNFSVSEYTQSLHEKDIAQLPDWLGKQLNPALGDD